MKKKYILPAMLTGIILSVFCVAGASTYTKFSSKFKKNFRDCDSYTETISSEFEGRTFKTTRKIIGWKNGFCRYEEEIVSPTDSYRLACSLSVIQVEELYNAMKSRKNDPETFQLELFAEQKDPNTGKIKYVSTGFQEIKGNKAYITWAKYQNNPYFCRPTKLK